MKYGKKVCTSLKQVRKQIADANGIPYEITPCPHDGSQCPGTCPKCEQEVRYIERELSLRRAAGKAVSLVGLSLGISAAFAANAPLASTKADIKDSTAVETPTHNDPAATEENMIFGAMEEQQPEFPGGEMALMKFIKDNLRYPADAVRDSIQGRVTLSFTVDTDGKIKGIEVMRSPDKRLSKEAVRVVKMMPKWKPGRLRGKIVRINYVLPVTFRMNAAPKTLANENPSAIKIGDLGIPTTEEDSTCIAKPDQLPEFPGGEIAMMKFIKENLDYPPSAARKGIQGRVILTFILEKDGKFSTIKVLRSPDDALSREAIRVIKKMPKWKPAIHEGKPVRVKFAMPVTFRL